MMWHITVGDLGIYANMYTPQKINPNFLDLKCLSIGSPFPVIRSDGDKLWRELKGIDRYLQLKGTDK